MIEKDWIKVVKQSKKQSASSIFSSRTCAVCKCALGSELMTNILVMCCDIIVKVGFSPKRWRKMLDAILEKRKVPTIGKIENNNVNWSIFAICDEGFFNEDKEEKIGKDEMFSKSNYGSIKNYSIEIAILEKKINIWQQFIIK